MIPIRSFAVLVTVLLTLLPCSLISYGLTNLAPNDPFPLYTAQYPQDFLLFRTKLRLLYCDTLCPEEVDLPPETFRFSVSFFRQTARRGRDFRKRNVQLGDIKGRWNMLALLYDPNIQFISSTINNFIHPADRPQPPCDNQQPFDDTFINGTCIPEFTDPTLSDPEERLGFFTVPISYRKAGARFDLAAQLWSDFGITFNIGVADIKQTNPELRDLSCSVSPQICNATTDDFSQSISCPTFGVSCTCLQYLIRELINEVDTVLEELNLDASDFHVRGIEDARIGAYWRHLFVLNRHSCCFPYFALIPYITTELGIPVAEERNNRKLFALSLGNNGHWAVSFTSGVSLAFYDTIEVNAEVGVTRFFDRLYHNLPLPTHPKQQVIFPFSADVTIRPGTNWYFELGMYAPRFLDKLSFYGQFVTLHHNEDELCIIKDLRLDSANLQQARQRAIANNTLCNEPLPPFALEKFKDRTAFDVQLANFGFTYDLSPHLTVGALAQIPISGRSVYRSNTLMLSLIATF